MHLRKAAFLDRDGTLIEAVMDHSEYPNRPTAPWKMNELKFVPDVRESIAALKEAGYLTIVITNQPDFNKGHVDKKTWKNIHDDILAETDPDDCFICKHLAEWKCSCRKPLPGMIFAAAHKWEIDLSKSFIVGDTAADTGAGKAAGCKTILIRWPYNEGVPADYSAMNLWDAAQLIIGHP